MLVSVPAALLWLVFGTAWNIDLVQSVQITRALNITVGKNKKDFSTVGYVVKSKSDSFSFSSTESEGTPSAA
jgi:hypothetical protein